MRCRILFILLVLFSVACSYGQVAPAASVKIGKITIDGNKHTRTRVILREMALHEGDEVPADSLDARLEKNRLRLMNLQLFNEVIQRTENNAGGLDLFITVKERWVIILSFILQFADRNFNTWWEKQDHDLRRATVGVTLTDKNFRGDLEQLAITAQGGYTQKLGISYSRPYANQGQTNGFGMWLSFSQSRQANYICDSNKLLYAGLYTGPVIMQQTEGGISFIFRPKYAKRHIFQLNYKDYKVSDTLLRLNSDFFSNKSTDARFLEFYYRMEYNGVDNWSYSLKGFKAVAQAVVRKGFTGLDFQSFINVEAGWFASPLHKWYTSAIFRGRVMYPAKQPYFFQGGLGTQTDYLRGYEYYVIDGSNYGMIRFDLKRELFNNTYSLPIRYFTTLPIRIYPKIFADLGYIDGATEHNNFLGNRILYSAGVGLDVVTLYDVKIRMELAWNHMSQNGLYLHFNSE